MKIGWIDCEVLDKRVLMPNLALMKLSTYHKNCGDTVELVISPDFVRYYDKVYMAKVFTDTAVDSHLLNNTSIIRGGTGFFMENAEDLPVSVEHLMPDYGLYSDFTKGLPDHSVLSGHLKNYTNFSIGYTTRGCFRKCDFCVNKKYDKVSIHSNIASFVDTKRPYIYLFDDNLFGYYGWQGVLEELQATKKRFCYIQGLDIRLMSKKKAEVLNNCKWYGDIIFAFDDYADKNLIERKLAIWRASCDKSTKLYILCAYQGIDVTDIVNIFKRLQILHKYQCIPYLMRYKSYLDSEFCDLYITIAQWCNQNGLYKKMSFRAFCEQTQVYKEATTGSTTKTKALITYRTFAEKYPDIAAKYMEQVYFS